MRRPATRGEPAAFHIVVAFAHSVAVRFPHFGVLIGYSWISLLMRVRLLLLEGQRASHGVQSRKFRLTFALAICYYVIPCFTQ